MVRQVWGSEECSVSTSITAPIGRSATGVRKFPLAFRVEFLQAWDQCVERGSKVRLMREYGLARQTVNRWLLARERGDFGESMAKAAIGTPSRSERMAEDRAELARLREENERLKAKVAQAEAVQDILGKAFELLEGINESSTMPDPELPPALMSLEQYRDYLTRRNLS